MEYNLIVTDDPCAKDKDKLISERKSCNETHFSCIWDYHANIMRTNMYVTLVTDTIQEATPTRKKKFNGSSLQLFCITKKKMDRCVDQL